MKNIEFILFLIFSLFITSCGREDDESVDKERNLSNEKIEITVVTYDDADGMRNNSLEGERGFFRSDLDGDWCEIHVPKIDDVDDDITTTWGHELMHCIYGCYHGDHCKVE